MASLVRREREALCDLAVKLGPDAPTLQAGRTVADVVGDLLAVERRARVHGGFADMVERLRRPGLTWLVLPGIRRLTLLDLVVAHEDLRRSRRDVRIGRRLTEADDDALWRALGRSARRLFRDAPVPVVVARSDPPKSTRTVLAGPQPVVITGMPLELVLAAHGRHRLDNVSIRGPRPSVDRMRTAGFYVFLG